MHRFRVRKRAGEEHHGSKLAAGIQKGKADQIVLNGGSELGLSQEQSAGLELQKEGRSTFWDWARGRWDKTVYTKAVSVVDLGIFLLGFGNHEQRPSQVLQAVLLRHYQNHSFPGTNADMQATIKEHFVFTLSKISIQPNLAMQPENWKLQPDAETLLFFSETAQIHQPRKSSNLLEAAVQEILGQCQGSRSTMGEMIIQNHGTKLKKPAHTRQILHIRILPL